MYREKRLFAILLLVLMTAGMVLGSYLEITQPVVEEPEVSWSSIKETIYVWYSDEALSGYIGTAAVNFGEAEGVRVIPVLKSSYGYLEEVNAITLDPQEQMPDAYVINNDELEKAYLAGLATEISDPGQKVTEKTVPETAIAAVSYGGRKVAYPFYFDTCVLLYNRNYLNMWVKQQAEREAQEQEKDGTDEGGEASQEAEEDTEDTEEAAVEEIATEEIIKPDGLPLTVDGILYFADTFDAPEGVDDVMKWDVSDIFYNYWVVGKYLTVGGESGDDYSNIRINNEETVKCLEVYQALNQFFYIEANAVNYESSIQDFFEGRTVFTIGSADVIQRLKSAKEEGEINFRYGITTLPQISTKLGSRPLSVTNAVAVNGYSEHKELANRFAEYLTQEFAGELYDRAGKISVTAAANRGDEMRRIFYNQYGESVSLPKMMEIGNLWLQLEALFAKVWSGEEVLPLVQELESQVSTQIQVE